jgi:uncharacterized protein YbjT (DUF2867 family)
MDTILVVGATGQLGSATIKRLHARGANVRAMVRSAEALATFQALGVEAVLGDLTDPASLERACSGATVVAATANTSIPTRSSDTFEAVERYGYRNLINAAKAARVSRFVYTSAPVSKVGPRLSAFIRYKRETEETLAASGLEYVVLRAGVFMDISFAMMGSTLPLRGAEHATVLRPFAFANRHFDRIKDSIERKHVAMIPGDGSARHAFICVDDVAQFLASAALRQGPPGIHVAAGPEALSFLDVVRIYERVLGVSLRVQKAPALVFRVMATALRPFSPAGANLMCLNYVACTENTPVDLEAARAFGVRLTTAEEFLRGKAEARTDAATSVA